MGIYIEALILYILLFFSGSAAFFAGMTTAAEFSAIGGLVNIFMYFIPALALIWYLIFKSQKPDIRIFKPGKKDLAALVITLPCILITGFAVTFLSSYLSGAGAQTTLHSPATVPGWIVLCIICFFSAYLEESFFRYYLLSKRKEMRLNSASALTLSVTLFAVCHLYGGLWSFINAAISGTFLGLIFLRYNSIHGLAIAHALYNISAFVYNALIN